ncbi:MAG TPA: hypothetical protein VMH81_33620 [Bryobacteraceae bacterium]|nr:hypothetical protein [Bryobacteraceae bacterium]
MPLLKGAIYQSDSLVRGYALNALAWFEDDVLTGWIPAAIKASGPTPELAYLLSWRRNLFQERGSDIARAVS